MTISLCQLLIDRGKQAIVNHLLADITFRSYARKSLRDRPGLTHYCEFQGGRHELRQFPDLEYVLDAAQAELFEDAIDNIELFVATENKIIVMCLFMMPNFWIFDSESLWKPAICDPDADDIQHLVFEASFINKYSNKLQNIYSDPENWLILPVETTYASGIWFDRNFNEEDDFSF